MAGTFRDAKITEIAINSQDSTTGEIRTTQIVQSDTSLDTTPAGDTDPDNATIFRAEELELTVTVADHDFLFVDTMNDGSTAEDTMPNTLYVQVVCEGGTLNDSSSNTWHEVRATTSEVGDVSDPSAGRNGQLQGTLQDHGGNFKLA